VAERLVQTRGFNGFSYADVAAEVGVTTASLHYHFPSKAELGRALVTRYAAGFQAALVRACVREPRAPGRLAAYARVYGDVLASGRMCLCGMLAAEYETLPKPVQRAIRAYLDADEAWLTGVLERGRDAGELSFAGSARDEARRWTASLEGAMLLARPYGDVARLEAVAKRLLAEVVRPAGKAPAKGSRRPRRR
jgi:TetR/AcrR family transcriptional repressor of nem operon